MKWPKDLVVVTVLVLTLHCWGEAPEPAQRKVASVGVISPSVSTSMEATRILAKQGWTRGKMKSVDAILVVVRSCLPLPLRQSYGFVGDLKNDADSQLNIAGPQFHVYLYVLGDDLECTQIKHISYDAGLP